MVYFEQLVYRAAVLRVAAGSGYKAAMELKEQGRDVKPGDKAKCKWCGGPIEYIVTKRGDTKYWSHASEFYNITCSNASGERCVPKK